MRLRTIGLLMMIVGALEILLGLAMVTGVAR